MDEISYKCNNLKVESLGNLSLPHKYLNDIHVCEVNTDKFVFRMKLCNKEEFINFLEQWVQESHITWRIKKTDPNNMSAGNKNLFWRQYRCQSSNSRILKSTEKPSKKHTDCKAAFTVTIKNIRVQCRSKDEHLPKYPTIIKGCFNHNHGILSAVNLKHKDVSKEVQLKFKTLFENGDNPVTALEKHKVDLQAKYKDDYVFKVADRSLCPDIKWCYRLCKSMQDKEDPIQDPIQAKSEEQLNSQIVLDTFQSCYKLIEEKVQTEPEFVSAVAAFNQAFKSCKSDTALLHALHRFGKTRGRPKKNLNVRPTLKAQRKKLLENRKPEKDSQAMTECISEFWGVDF